MGMIIIPAEAGIQTNDNIDLSHRFEGNTTQWGKSIEPLDSRLRGSDNPIF